MFKNVPAKSVMSGEVIAIPEIGQTKYLDGQELLTVKYVNDWVDSVDIRMIDSNGRSTTTTLPPNFSVFVDIQ